MARARMRKAGVALALVFLLLGVAAWFIDFDASGVGGELLRQTRASTGLDFRVSRSRMNLLRGIQLENVVASGSFPTGRYTVAMARMRFVPRFRPLLRGELDFERVVLELPEVEILYGLDLENETPADEGGTGRRRRREGKRSPGEPQEPAFDWSINELLVRDGTVRVRDVRRDDEGIRLDGVRLVLRDPTLGKGALTLIHGVRASGELEAGELQLGATILRDVEAEVSTATGRMELAGSFETEHGAFEGTANLNFNSLPFRHSIEMRGRLRAAEMVIAMEGFGLDPTKLKGEGRLELSGEAGEIPLRIEEGRILLEGDRVGGSIELDGRLELERR